MSSILIGLKIKLTGIVQGVGFRPFVFTTADKYQLTGRVWNNSQGVEIEVFGVSEMVIRFRDEINTHPPVLSRIDHFESKEIPFEKVNGFTILESRAEDGQFLPVSPDVSICPDCLQELFDPSDRRYRYPFINCTHCGPRFSIIQDIPYDRPKTTMAGFSLCPACKAEYEDPTNRRFHAQPIACPVCGPRIQFIYQNQIVAKFEGAISTARQFLQDGKILAIKGLGGYHLACDASNEKSVQRLRERKQRSDRAFALMSYNLETIQKFCLVNSDESAALQSPQHPIVLLEKNSHHILPEIIAPSQNMLGFLLPYTPLHHLLLEPEEGFPSVFVMTSGNTSDEPIAYEDDEALQRLIGIADGFLLHNRPIQMRVDDSVIRYIQNKPYFVRRSRGYAPDPIKLSNNMPEILACGAELKNTFALSRENYAFISHHIGDLENYETLHSFETGVEHFQKLFRITPRFITADLHPDYLSTRYALDRSNKESLPLIQVQHHHAHLAGCLADNQYFSDDPVIGLIFDGTGYGTDGNIWGGEILIGSFKEFQRRFHLEEMPLPGGDSAIRNPYKIALSYLAHANIQWQSNLPPYMAASEIELDFLSKQLSQHINTPVTTSMGRLFDAVASLIGVRQIATYEGQAAIELENRCSPSETKFYPFSIKDDKITLSDLLNHIIMDMNLHVSIEEISAKFHNSLALLCLELCKIIRQENGINTVALSGGVWQNVTLLRKTSALLNSEGFSVLQHRQIPTNDGGISLGQLMVASSTISESRG